MTIHASRDAEADPVLVDRLCSALLAGEPVVMPTDTVYGLAVLPGVPGGTARLFALKDRRPDSPLAVLVADADAARALSGPLGPEVDRIVERLWPGALTLVLPRAAPVAVWDLGGDPRTIGVRCPAHTLVRAVARRVGPVVTTSANRHGEPTPPTAAEAAATLTGPVAMVADGGALRGAASTVVDATGTSWTLLREGPVDLASVRAASEGQ